MRRKEGSGEKEFRAATEVIWLRIASRDDGWKRYRSFKSVMRRVFDGGDGEESGGRLDRSRERDGRDDRKERFVWEGGERGEEVDSAILVVVRWWLLGRTS